ncbi:MAG: hypothetical protein BHW61_08925 [Sutterella sp. 63_29]|nr:MAG: hypothetical protein BHW61_08925 [Sutterella sp. 63_29]
MKTKPVPACPEGQQRPGTSVRPKAGSVIGRAPPKGSTDQGHATPVVLLSHQTAAAQAPIAMTT